MWSLIFEIIAALEIEKQNKKDPSRKFPSRFFRVLFGESDERGMSKSGSHDDDVLIYDS